MAQLSRAALEAFFETGDKPTQSQFKDLIDSQFNFIDDGTPAVVAGINEQVQYNDTGNLGANANFTWDIPNDFLGIGAPPAINAPLHVRGKGNTGATFSIKIDNFDNTPGIYVRDDGNIGINRANPTNLLQLQKRSGSQFGMDLLSIAGNINAQITSSSTAGGQVILKNLLGTQNLVILNLETAGGYSFFDQPVMVGSSSIPPNTFSVKALANGEGIELLSQGNVQRALILSNAAVGGQIALRDSGGVNSVMEFNNAINQSFILQDIGIGLSAGITAKMHIKGANGYDQLRMETQFTPANSADANGNVGDISWDAGFIYIKTAAGAWKRTALAAF